MNSGVVYAVVASDFEVGLCRLSLMTLRWSGYSGPVSIFLDESLAAANAFGGLNAKVEKVRVPSGGMHSRWLKTRVGVLSPYENTLYLDNDVLIFQPIDSIWAGLRSVEIAAALDPALTLSDVSHASQEEKNSTLNAYAPSEAHFNSGVLLWRKSGATRVFFERWHAEWQRYKHIDELALARARLGTGIEFGTLAPKYNMPDRSADSIDDALRKKIILWHITHKKHRMSTRNYQLLEDRLAPQVVGAR